MSNVTTYDWVIIGAGPAGLTLAYTLGSIGKKVLLLDSAPSIGGCHRVIRVGENSLFTEHAPRIYSHSYTSVSNLLETMGSSFEALFTPYNFEISTIGGHTLSFLSFKEKIILALNFLTLALIPNYGKKTSMKDFMLSHSFSLASSDYIDRLCRLTDGAASDRYTLYEFLQLANQQFLYKLAQPKLPNDKGLWKIWSDAMNKTNNVTVKLNNAVQSIGGTASNFTIFIPNATIKASNVVLAISPLAIASLLQASSEPIISAFGPLSQITSWSQSNSYINDIGITFHWNQKLELPKVWGFPASDWAIAFIVLSDYMTFDEPQSQTVISTCITRMDSVSTVTNKTANQTDSSTDLINEVFRQLGLAFGSGLPSPTASILSPTVKRIGSNWIDSDSAYVETTADSLLGPESLVSGLYAVGTENGKSKYAFTSMESAIQNALKFVHKYEPETGEHFPICYSWTVIEVIKTIILIILIIILLFILFRMKKLH